VIPNNAMTARTGFREFRECFSEKFMEGGNLAAGTQHSTLRPGSQVENSGRLL
jgi:hypothetical protein